MKKRFRANVNDKFQFDLTSEDALPFEITNSNHVHAVNDGHSVNVSIAKTEFSARKYTIRLNAGYYEVYLKNELDLLIEDMGLMSNIASISNELKAPMPGLIVEVLTTKGAKVKAGDGLLVLEAMKMENKLTAPHDGTIKAVKVKAADAVDKGTVLIEFENNEEDK